MYTTPRKVKQESRLRRSLSLTNNSNNRSSTQNGELLEDSSFLQVTTCGSGTLLAEQIYVKQVNPLSSSFCAPASFLPHQLNTSPVGNCCSPSASSALSASSLPSCCCSSSSSLPVTVDPTHNQNNHHPPPYREPPFAGGIYSNCKDNNNSFDASVISSNAIAEPQSVFKKNSDVVKDWNSFKKKSESTTETVSLVEKPSTTTLAGDQEQRELSRGTAAATTLSRSSSTSEIFQTHSSKFPIVKEVILHQQQQILKSTGNISNGNGQVPGLCKSVSAQNLCQVPASVNQLGNSIPTTTTVAPVKVNPCRGNAVSTSCSAPKVPLGSNGTIFKELPSSIFSWGDASRKAFTLDSSTAKRLQEKFLGSVSAAQQGKKGNSLHFDPTQRITRRNSLDLQKFIQVFNEEQILMASSMQGLHHNNTGSSLGGGIDNSGLELGGSHNNIATMYNGSAAGKPSSYYSDSTNSATSSSQSQSLSSSNTDSLDTVIFKGPSSVSSGGGSLRDWQAHQRASIVSAASNQNISMDQQQQQQQPLDFDHSRSNSKSEINSYRDTTFDGQSYQISPPQASPYQHQAMSHCYNGNNYSMEYRSSLPSNTTSTNTQNGQPQPQQQQIHPQHQLPIIQSSHGLTLRNGMTSAAAVAAYHQQHQQLHQQQQQQLMGSNPHLPTKSPLLSHKQFSSTDGLILDKAKEANCKQFSNTTAGKSYSNHIKDMISSRFGNSMMNNGKNTMNYNNVNGGYTNQAYTNNSTGLDMTDIGLPSTGPYQHQQLHPQHIQHQHLQQNSSQQQQIPYYASPPFHTTPVGVAPPNPSPSAYKSVAMNGDRKNVNTSFRKAIQKSTQKSNLVEDSVQMRTIHESSGGVPGGQFVSAGEHIQYQQQQQPLHQTVAEQRAQRALDKLLGETSLTSNSPQLRANGPPPYPDRGPPPSQHQHSILRNANCFGTKQPALSPSYCKASPAPNMTPAPSLQRPVDEPPPLPTSQTPSLSLQDVRENGDGSSVNTNGLVNSALEQEKPSLNNNSAIVKSEHLKQMTSDLQNLALSVAVGSGEPHSSGSDGDMKGSQPRIGSGQSHDSGVGTINSCKASPPPNGQLSSGSEPLDGLIGQRHKFANAGSHSSGNDSEWIDIVETEMRKGTDTQRNGPAGKINATSQSQHQQSQSHQHQQASSSNATCSKSPKLPKKFDLSTYNKKSSHEPAGPSSSQVPTAATSSLGQQNNNNTWNNTRPRATDKNQAKSSTMSRVTANNNAKDAVIGNKPGKLTRNAMNQIMYSLNDDNGDITSTTTGGLDLESMLDGQTENTSDDDDDLSTTIDTTDAHAIRRQLESLETMYTEVLKVLGAKKFGGTVGMGSRYPPTTDLRGLRRRPYGSMSSLPSSVSSRPFKENKRRFDEKKKVKDIKSINRRFQRLESHVVTLARSVAHLSSEMRTQHLMVQEMESIRNELAQLRSQIMKMPVHVQPQPNPTQSGNPAGQQRTLGRQGGANYVNSTDWTAFRNALPSLTNPCRVRKLTKFFGDEPPLIRIFLKKLGYEKYAIHFEQERIGIMELPYLTEERLQKMGIPMGPRLRILQEAHMCLKPGAHFTVEHQLHNGNTGNLSVYVV